MAAKHLENSDIKKQEQIEDITTCIICTEVYTDPKALPCMHTFCMKCLRETGLKTNKGPGDEMPCPICRRPFKISKQGFPGLPKHFFIERLIQLSRVSDPSAGTKVLCSVCLEESKEKIGKEIPAADTYCIECKYNLCDECRSDHIKFKMTKNHKLTPISESGVHKDVLTNSAPNVCEVHEKMVLNVYCADCKSVECAICFIEKHKNHEGSDVNKCVDDFRKQIQNNTETMMGCITQAQTKKTELLKAKSEIQEQVESLECDILKRKDEIKEHTDKHASSLLQRLSWEQQGRLKEIQMATDDTEAYLSHLKSYNSYCQRIAAEGSASDICRALSDLSIGAIELQQQCQPVIEIEIKQFKLCFRQSEIELLEQDCDNLVGEIEEEGDSKPKKPNTKKLLTEQLKEIAILKQENDELKVNCKANLQEMDKNKTSINTQQDSNYKLKKELNAEKLNNIALKTSSDTEKDNYESRIKKLKQELEDNMAAMNAIKVKSNELIKELDAEKKKNNSLDSLIANYTAHTEKLMKELEDNMAAMKALHVSNDKLKQEFDAEKSNNIAFQTSCDTEKANNKSKIENLKQELKNNKKAMTALQVKNNELKQTLDAEKQQYTSDWQRQTQRRAGKV